MKRRIRNPARGSALGVALAAALAACAVHAPEVEVESVRLGGLGMSGGTLLVDVRIENPNRFGLTATALRYDLEIGADDEDTWVELVAGEYTEEVNVPARDTARVSVPVEFTYQSIGGVGSRLLRRGAFDYRATGEVDARTPVGRRTIPFRHRGTVALFGDR